MPPDDARLTDPSPHAMRAAFDRRGRTVSSHATPLSKYPLMHRTGTIDYGIVLESGIVPIADEGAPS